MATASSSNSGAEQAKQHILRISDIDKEPLEMLMPISGFENMPLVSLETAVESLVSCLPTIQSYAYSAKQRCKKPPPDGLTVDGSASIMLYSMGWKPLDQCLYVALNAALRSENRELLEPWFLYLKLFLTALSHLPPIHRNVYRGIKLDLSDQYETDKTVVWWGFSSCTTSVSVLQSELFLGKTGTRTMFTIECDSGKDIQKHSYYPSEGEILLHPATQFKIIGCLDQGNGLHIIQLQETKPPFPLLHPIFHPSNSTKSLSETGTKKKLEVGNSDNASSDTIDKLVTQVNEMAKYDVKQKLIFQLNIHHNTKWRHNGITVAGGNKEGHHLTQLNSPFGMYVDDDQTVYVADAYNNRIVEWKWDATMGRVVAGGNGRGSQMNQLNWPVDVIFDKDRHDLIICDRGNRRVVRWSRQNGMDGHAIISNIDCCGLTTDNLGYLYVSDYEEHEVRRWKIGDTCRTLVAGGNEKGNSLNQLDGPTNVFVDEDHSVYISDRNNNRVMKWIEGATEGIVVAGGQGEGNDLTQLSRPRGVIVDHMGTVYVADFGNHRIVRWFKGATHGDIVVGGHRPGKHADQLDWPGDLSFDRQGNLYVVDSSNNRVQRFDIDRS